MTFNLRRGGTAIGMMAVLLALLSIAVRPAFADTIYPNSPNPHGSEFTASADGWQDMNPSCALLGILNFAGCNVQASHNETVGAPSSRVTPPAGEPPARLTGPGSLETRLTALAEVLGLLYSGTVTWVSPQFTVSPAAQATSVFAYDRALNDQAGLDISPQATVNTVLHDISAGTDTPLISGDTFGPSVFQTKSTTVPASALVAGHKYVIKATVKVSTTFLQLAQGQINAYLDNIKLTVKDGTPFFSSKPAVETLPATNIAADSATLNGTVDPLGIPAGYHYDFGTTTSYGQVFPASDASAGDGIGKVSAPAQATGLTRCTTYHYRLVGLNSFGTSFGADRTFMTACSPTATTLPATSISATTAILNGRVTPNGVSTAFHYELGKTTGYELIKTDSGLLPASFDPFEPLSVPVNNLTPQTTYHFRVVGENSLGSGLGQDATFTTPPLTGPAGVNGTNGVNGAPGARGPAGPAGVSGSSTNTTIRNDSGLLRIRASLVKVGTAGRRRGQVRLPIFCTKKTGRTCAGTVKIRTISRINPSAFRKKAKRRVTFITFECQLAQGKKGYAISNMNLEKLQLIEKLKSIAVTISVQVSDSGGNRQTIVRNGRLRAVKSP